MVEKHMLDTYHLRKACLMWNCLSLKKKNLSKVVFWLPYKLLNHWYSTICRKATEAKEGTANWPISSILKSVIENQK
jgi:hypothetical protein